MGQSTNGLLIFCSHTLKALNFPHNRPFSYYHPLPFSAIIAQWILLVKMLPDSFMGLRFCESGADVVSSFC